MRRTSKKPTSKPVKAPAKVAAKKASAPRASTSSPALDLLRECMDLAVEKGFSDLEWEDPSGTKIRLSRGGRPSTSAPQYYAPAMMEAPQAAATPSAPSVPAASAAAVKDASVAGGKEITSPFVGTFYASPSPTADAYVRSGSKVKKGETLCIIEAMKLMNTLEAEEAAEIVEILVRNGEAVEYGTPLFRVRSLA